MENTTNATHFEIIPALLKEFSEEAIKTRKMLALVPDDKHDWAPHSKSMKMGPLAIHIAELPSWVTMALTTEELDFAKMDWTPTDAPDSSALVQLLDKSYEAGKASLEAANEELLTGAWLLRSGDKIHAKMTKYETIRHSFSQTTHHRAQLGVYLRLLDIPLPGTYGPSADDTNF